ncbi:MAG: DUF1223 domain-containing protein [Alphaproteobacteria bacterium]|nr:DUF1223 domain-containing protein [Alphaproteobacteria bacterium]
MVGFSGPVWGQQNPVVVELYTSQGCAACPPADDLLNEIADHDAVLPLALHVDYWDYIGWADTFGKAAFSARQKSYARKMGRKSVYTPQMIIGGIDDIQGNAAMQVMGLIADHHMNPFADGLVTVEIAAQDSGGVTVEARSSTILEFAVDVQIVRFLDRATVEITAGENAGREITYRNIVTDWTVLDAWDGSAPFSYTVPGDVPDGTGLAVLVQEQGLGPILAAARYP